jgi:hypothetical protein
VQLRKRIFFASSCARCYPTVTATSHRGISARFDRDIKYVIIDASLVRRPVATSRRGCRQQSTSDGGDGRRDGDGTATAMDGVTAMRRQRDGDYDATFTGRRRRMAAVAGGSAGAKTKTTIAARRRCTRRRQQCKRRQPVAAAWRRRRRWWWRYRTTAVAAEAWRWQLGGGAVTTAVVFVAPAAWRR